MDCGFTFIGDLDEHDNLHCPKCGAKVRVFNGELPSKEEQAGILLNNLPYTTQIYHRAKRPDQTEWVMRWGVKTVAENDDLLICMKQGIREVLRLQAEKLEQKGKRE
jgi:hypothetical protein